MEEWKFINNSKIYQVSNMGRIRCVEYTIIRCDGKPYHIKPRWLKPFHTKSGYMIFEFSGDIKKHILIHRAVLETFNPTKDMDSLQVNHIDGNKSNNNLDNLEWVTRCENMQHAMKKGLFCPQNRCGEKHPMCKLSEEAVIEIKDKLKLNKNKRGFQRQLAKEYGVSETTISEIKTGRKRKVS